MEPISAILTVGMSLINKLFPDPAVANEAKLKLLEMQQKGELALITSQTDINKVEAASDSVFVAGWRPFIGWVCGSAFAVQYLVGPLLSWGTALYGKPIIFPELDMGAMMTILGGMLGLGGFRTFEKLKGVQRNH